MREPPPAERQGSTTHSTAGRGPRVTALQQDREIPDFLGHLVRDDGQGCGDSQGNRSGECNGDGDAVHKVVQGVADQDHFPGAGVNVTGMFVAMTPQGELLEQEEENDAGQNRRHDRFARKPAQRMRNHAEKRRPEQGADRVRDQAGRKEGQPLPFEEQKRSGQTDGTHRSEQAKRYDEDNLQPASSHLFVESATV